MACGNALYKNEDHICSRCQHSLPKTNFHKSDDNPIMKLFWGRVNLSKASSFYYFNKGNKVQNLLHQLKYNGQQELGMKLGRMYGSELIRIAGYETIDYIIPVPLHFKKEKKRGYNQSEMIAIGLSQIFKKPVLTTVLLRSKNNETQTNKARFKRWENVDSVFEINNRDMLKGKNILLVDDVITTGATLESCANQLLQIPDTQVNVATIAYANL